LYRGGGKKLVAHIPFKKPIATPRVEEAVTETERPERRGKELRQGKDLLHPLRAQKSRRKSEIGRNAKMGNRGRRKGEEEKRGGCAGQHA